MRYVTIEFQRFGDATGALSPGNPYLRTVRPTKPVEPVPFGLPQRNLSKAMNAFDYERLQGAGTAGARQVAEKVLVDLGRYVEDFLAIETPPSSDAGLCQVDIVTRALELAQLPFEVLEETHPELVVTRRVRQPWEPPAVVRRNRPRVLFAWAEPSRRAGSDRRMEVPHERHRDLLEDVLGDWGGVSEACVEVPNATRRKLEVALSTREHGFTHVHLLAHGERPARVDPNAPIDLEAEPEPSTYLALEDEAGVIDRVPPGWLAGLFGEDLPRPESFAIATCHSGEVEPLEAGGTLAHVLHAAGVPIVVASQLALTKAGADELIDTFLRQLVGGEDPRKALRACRNALRAAKDRTFYDRVALVGYVHLESGREERLTARRLEIEMSRLEAATKQAARRMIEAVAQEKALADELRAEIDAFDERFTSVRDRLTRFEQEHALTTEQIGELRGIQASSYKRRAEAAWKLSRLLPAGPEATKWLERSHQSLRDAGAAYQRASRISLDHHWQSVQWLVLEAITRGSLAGLEADWIIAKRAAQYAVECGEAPGATPEERRKGGWGHGSLCELHLLAPLTGGERETSKARASLDALAKIAEDLGDPSLVDATLSQLGRYTDWWHLDPHWKLPGEVVEQAQEMRSYLRGWGQPSQGEPDVRNRDAPRR